MRRLSNCTMAELYHVALILILLINVMAGCAAGVCVPVAGVPWVHKFLCLGAPRPSGGHMDPLPGCSHHPQCTHYH